MESNDTNRIRSEPNGMIYITSDWFETTFMLTKIADSSVSLLLLYPKRKNVESSCTVSNIEKEAVDRTHRH